MMPVPATIRFSFLTLLLTSCGEGLLDVSWGFKMLPQRKLQCPFGEDAVCIRRSSSEEKTRVVVTDGVGGFRENHGVSAGPFARELANSLAHGKSNVRSDLACSLQELAVRGLVGAATLACLDISEFKGNTIMEVTTLGDCEVAVFRPTFFSGGKLSASPGESTKEGVRWLPVFKSGRGIYSSNGAPQQVMISTKRIVASGYERELRTSTFKLQQQDCLLLGSDGLFSNLQELEILAHVSLAAAAGKGNAARLAANLAKAAKKNFYHADDISAVAGIVAG